MSDDAHVRALYAQVVDGWNRLDARAIASAFTRDAELVGYDGSAMRGRDAIESGMAAVFADHKPGRWVALVRDVHFPAPDVAVLRAHAAWLNPRADSPPIGVQTTVALRETADAWRIALLQTTPAALHGRPEQLAELQAELRAAASTSLS
jgi:uncharacterized protein (TIGR02246 family)